jgi:pimeloyl-ACP methyl ester carboxylesterase
MLLEALFLLFMNIKYKVFKSMDSKHLPTVDSEFSTILKEFELIEDMDSFLSGWFFGADPESITEDDMIEWTASQFFNTNPSQMTTHQWSMTNEFLQLVNKKLKIPLRSRAQEYFCLIRQAPLKKILLTLDPPVIYHRPIVYYLVVRGIDRICRIILQLLGFSRNTDGELPFYMRHGTSDEPSIVFFHGLGIGLTSYLPFVLALSISYPDRNILLFEMPSITMRLDENHVLPKEYASHVAESLYVLGLQKIIVAGHSLGTACVRWMDLYYPDLIATRLFIDPICFSLWDHHIAHNALYREPKTFHELFIMLVAMSEPGHATFLHRYFVWFHNTYFTSDLPENCYIFLSEKDNIVNTPGVLKYLLRNPNPSRRLVLIEAFRHGQILASPEVARVVSAIKQLDKLQ